MIIKMFFPREQQFEKSAFFLLAYFRKLALGHGWEKKNSMNLFLHENNLSPLSIPSVKTS